MKPVVLLVVLITRVFNPWDVCGRANFFLEKKPPVIIEIGGTKQPIDVLLPPGSLSFGELTQAEYRNQLTRLDALVRAKDLQGITDLGDAARMAWAHAGGESYGLLMLEITNLISNNFSQFELSQKYSALALAQADTFSLELETRLLRFLARDLSSKSVPDKWTAERATKAKLWLHGWRRLERGLNRSFDFNNRPTLNVIPPRETGLPSGVAPEAIRDAALRGKYEAALAANSKKKQEYNRQFRLRSLDQTFPKDAERYLARVYAEPPNNQTELRLLLSTYGVNQSAKQRLLAEVGKRSAASQRQ